MELLTPLVEQQADVDRSGDWCQTFTGRKFWHMDPKPGDFSLQDIARGLSNECRFGGQIPKFYSVAQHSLLVHYLVGLEFELDGLEREDALKWALLHDAAEAYMKDIPRPQKRWWGAYKAAETHVQEQIAKRFGVPVYHGDTWPLPPLVTKADNDALMTEALTFYTDGRALNWTGVPGTNRADELPEAFKLAWDPDRAMHAYIDTFKKTFGLGPDEW